jgi:osmotically-inducible protein OsmY
MSAQSNADAKLVQQVNSKLSMRGFRPPCHVSVACDSGQITLTGSVTQAHLKLSAAQVAQGISGVKRVVNQLIVKAAERRT